MAKDLKKAENAIREFLKAMGHDVNREGLRETPKRYVKFWDEFCSPPEFNFTTFQNENVDQMIIQKNIPFTSVCEHHLAPFWGTASIAYIPNKNKIVGISKLARTLDLYARQPQNQERIGTQVVERLQKELKPKGVAIVIKARHTCVEMRGVKKHDTWTVTSAMTGCFKKELNARQEFLRLIQE